MGTGKTCSGQQVEVKRQVVDNRSALPIDSHCHITAKNQLFQYNMKTGSN